MSIQTHTQTNKYLNTFQTNIQEDWSDTYTKSQGHMIGLKQTLSKSLNSFCLSLRGQCYITRVELGTWPVMTVVCLFMKRLFFCWPGSTHFGKSSWVIPFVILKFWTYSFVIKYGFGSEFLMFKCCLEIFRGVFVAVGIEFPCLETVLFCLKLVPHDGSTGDSAGSIKKPVHGNSRKFTQRLILL